MKIFSLLAPNQVPNLEALKILTIDLRLGIAGYAYRFNWSKLEPQRGVYDWSLVKQALKQSAKLGKICMMHLTAGKSAPGWVGPFLSREYLDAWRNFLEEFAQEFGGEPCIWAIHISGCGEAGELTLRGLQGFTDEAVMEAWKEVVQWYVDLFPGKILYTPGVTPNMAGGSGGSEMFVRYILANYKDRIGIYNHGLGGKEGQPHDLIREAVELSGGGGYQAGGGFLPLSWGYPRYGDPELAFRKAEEDGVVSLEIYRADLLKRNQRFLDLIEEYGAYS